MKKKLSIFTIALAIIILLSACAVQKKPEDTVTDFMIATQESDLELMVAKISPDDTEGKKDVSKIHEVKIDSFETYFVEWSKENAKKITYEIKEIVIDKDSAKVTVQVKYVDSTPLLQAILTEYMAEALAIALKGEELTAAETSELVVGIIKKQVQLVEETFVEKTIEFKCIKIENEWYIEKINDELLDVMTSNILSFIKKVSLDLDIDFDLNDD